MRRSLLIAVLVGCGHSAPLPVPASTPELVIEEWVVDPADEGVEPARVSRDDPSFVPSSATYIDANVLRARREPSGVKFQIDVGTDTIREFRLADFIDDAGHVIPGPKILVFLSGRRVSVGTVRVPSARVLSKRVRLYRPADSDR